MDIMELDLTVRTFNVLTRCLGLTTVEGVCLYTPEELLQQNNFGKKSLNELRQKLCEAGYCLKDDEEALTYTYKDNFVGQPALVVRAMLDAYLSGDTLSEVGLKFMKGTNVAGQIMRYNYDRVTSYATWEEIVERSKNMRKLRQSAC